MFLERPCAGGVATLGEPAVELTILMPCLNEAETLAACVGEAAAALAAAGVVGEVLVADNGSTDGSQALALAAGARVVEVAGRGYGNALAGGIAAARGRLRADGRRRRLLRFRRAAAVPGAAARWRGSGHGLPPAGRRRADPAGCHALEAPLDRQPDPDRPGPPVLHRTGPRLPLRPARLPARRRPGAGAAMPGHGVRLGDGGAGELRRPGAGRGAGDAAPATAARARPICAAGATAGAICASCCCSRRAGCS